MFKMFSVMTETVFVEKGPVVMGGAAVWNKRRYRVIAHPIHYTHVWHSQGTTLIYLKRNKNMNAVNGVFWEKGRVDRCGRVEERVGMAVIRMNNLWYEIVKGKI